MITRKCVCCGTTFQAREAGVKRGWAKFCSKRCKAVRQEARTGQHKAYKERCEGEFLTFANAHQYDNTEL